MATCFTSEHFRRKAKRFLPRMVFDYVDGAAGGENTLMRNRRTLDDIRLMPQALSGCMAADMRTELFGASFAFPFGVAPVGLANLVRPGTDAAIATAAVKANIPYCLSTAGTTSIETISRLAPDHCWFQLYVGEDPAMTDDLIARAKRAGRKVLLVTVDVPAPGKRVRDLVNGLTMPLRPTLALALDVATHPSWALETFRKGAPKLETIAPYFDGKAKPHASQVARMVSSPRLDWAELRRIRAAWDGVLVVKGIINPQDAKRAAELGADGIVVSNHGGRQLDASPAPIEVLPRIRQAVGDGLKVLFDSGIRSGDDIVRALALGADFVLVGRPFIFSVAALGPENGPRRVIEVLSTELENTLIHLGCGAASALDDRFVA